MKENINRIFSESFGIVVVSVLIGFIFNIFSPNGVSVIYSANNNPFFSAKRTNYLDEFPQVIGLNGAKGHFDEGSALFIDSRPMEYYLEGHIPGAISLPFENFDERFEEIEHLLPRNHDIIVYCDNINCDLSTRLVYRLLQEGYLYCYIFENGIKHWTTMTYPISKGAEDYER